MAQYSSLAVADRVFDCRLEHWAGMLDLSYTGCTDEDIRLIAEEPGAADTLRVLHLNDTNVGDGVAPHLVRLRALVKLSLARRPISRATFAALADLPALSVLDLTGCRELDAA